jgi:hypothetical protein
MMSMMMMVMMMMSMSMMVTYLHALRYPSSMIDPSSMVIGQVRVDSMLKVAEIEEAEKDKMRAKCKKIIDHGITCFINRQLIYNFPGE